MLFLSFLNGQRNFLALPQQLFVMGAIFDRQKSGVLKRGWSMIFDFHFVPLKVERIRIYSQQN
jgi:hypothetical protein